MTQLLKIVIEIYLFSDDTIIKFSDKDTLSNHAKNIPSLTVRNCHDKEIVDVAKSRSQPVVDQSLTMLICYARFYQRSADPRWRTAAILNIRKIAISQQPLDRFR